MRRLYWWVTRYVFMWIIISKSFLITLSYLKLSRNFFGEYLLYCPAWNLIGGCRLRSALLRSGIAMWWFQSGWRLLLGRIGWRWRMGWGWRMGWRLGMGWWSQLMMRIKRKYMKRDTGPEIKILDCLFVFKSFKFYHFFNWKAAFSLPTNPLKHISCDESNHNHTHTSCKIHKNFLSSKIALLFIPNITNLVSKTQLKRSIVWSCLEPFSHIQYYWN